MLDIAKPHIALHVDLGCVEHESPTLFFHTWQGVSAMKIKRKFSKARNESDMGSC